MWSIDGKRRRTWKSVADDADDDGSPSARTGPGPFDDIFALARSLELDEGPAIRNPAVRDWPTGT